MLSVNHLEAMAQWSHFAKARGAFYLYVPAGLADVAQRLCEATKTNVTEIWVYYAIDSQAKFSMSYRSRRARAAAKAAKDNPVKRTPRKKAASKRVETTRKATKKKTPPKRVARKQSAAKRTVKPAARKTATTVRQRTAGNPVDRTSAKRRSLAGRKK